MRWGMKDALLRASGGDGQVRALAVRCAQGVELAKNIHNTSPVATAALGRLLAAGWLLAAGIKEEKGLLTLQIKGDGPIGSLVVTAWPDGRAKGYAARPLVDLPANARGKLDVGGAVGRGTLYVSRDRGFGEPYLGQIQLVSGEIAEDITAYLAYSEQSPGAVGLGVLLNKDNTIRQAGGFLVQLMPDATEETIDRLEANLAALPPVTSMLEEDASLESLLGRVLEGLQPRFYGESDICFACDCSREKMEKALLGLGPAELLSMAEAGEPVHMGCQFCQREHIFSREDLLALRSEGCRAEPEKEADSAGENTNCKFYCEK